MSLQERPSGDRERLLLRKGPLRQTTALTLLCRGIRRRLRREGAASPRCRAGRCWLRAPPGRSPCRRCHRCMPGERRDRWDVRTAGRTSDSRCYSYGKSPATQLTGCHVVSELLGILAAGAIPNHLRIAGVLQIPRSIAPLDEGSGCSAYRPGLCIKYWESEPHQEFITQVISHLCKKGNQLKCSRKLAEDGQKL